MSEKKKTKKANNIIGGLIILLGVSVVVFLMAYSYKESYDYLKRFKQEKRSAAEALYNNIMGLSAESYPSNPDDVMEIYNDAYLLLYGDMILDEKIIGEVLSKQRLLLDNELLEKNPYESQLAELKRSLDYLNEFGIYITGVDKKSAVYSETDSTECFVRVTQTTNLWTKYYWSFTLKKDKNDSLWKIASWQLREEQLGE